MFENSLGYDATELFVPPSVAGNRTFLSNLECIHNNSITGFEKYKCSSLKLTIRGDAIRISGSLATYMYGHNIRTLSADQFREGLVLLSSELGIDCSECYVWSVEFTGTFLMKYPPSMYYPLFRARRGFERVERRNGLYLQTESRKTVISIYDKYLEQESLDGFPKNLLRLEMKKRSFAKSIGMDYPVLASSLCEKNVYERFEALWHKEFSASLVEEGTIPVLPERLTSKSLSKIESDLCRSNKATSNILKRIVKSYKESGLIEPNLRAKLNRQLFAPNSVIQNERFTELREIISSVGVR